MRGVRFPLPPPTAAAHLPRFLSLFAAALPNIVNENNVLQRMEQQLGRMEQQLGRVEQRLGRIEQGQLVSRHNERARRLNRRAVSTVGNAALQPLRREEEAAAGGAYQLGALPTADIQFPEDTDALRAVGVVRPCRLRSDVNPGCLVLR